MTNSNYKLTKEDFKQINKRSLFTFQLGWNYERMQGSSYLFIILPQLRKMYGDGTPELKEMMKTHAQFFNTSNFFHTIITGIDLALEENEGIEAKDAVNGVKTGLMGPFAPIGDSVFGSLVPAIMGSIAASLAMNGNPLGVFLWIGVTTLINVFRWKQLEIAYKEGTKLVTTMRDKLSSLVEAASVMGVFMVGALIATMINFQFTAAPKIGDKVIDIQDLFNQIFPRLVPALFTAGIFWLLGRKGMTSTKAILVIVVFALAMAFFGILGV